MEVGQTVYLKGNSRRNEKGIREEVISKVGRKYIYVGSGYSEIKFHIGSLRQVTEYSPSWYLYLSKQDIINEEEFNKLSSEIRELFVYCKINLTLDQLRRIKDIISE